MNRAVRLKVLTTMLVSRLVLITNSESTWQRTLSFKSMFNINSKSLTLYIVCMRQSMTQYDSIFSHNPIFQ